MAPRKTMATTNSRINYAAYIGTIVSVNRMATVSCYLLRKYLHLCYKVCPTQLQYFHTLYGHVQRMAEGRLPRIALKWIPKQKRARGRAKKNWMEGIRKAMNERHLNEGQWEDRKQWRLGVGQRRKAY